MPRVQSPSSINTYLQCPRKYYFQYIEERPTKPSIHMVRGNVAHEVLEQFFMQELENDSGYRELLQRRLLELLSSVWKAHLPDMEKLAGNLDLDEMYLETELMLLNWVNRLTRKIDSKAVSVGAREAFRQVKPLTEQKYLSDELQVQGYIDAIEHHGDDVRLMDYKTSKYADITDAYRLQLAIYALLYEKRHGKHPSAVGIYFLNHDDESHEQILAFSPEMRELASSAITAVHERTRTDFIEDYPKKIESHCNWCDFRNICFGEKKLSNWMN